MARLSASALMSALTNAIVAGRLDVETARLLVIQSHASNKADLQQEIDLYPTVKVAAAAMGVSRSTLYRRLGVSDASES